jgi:hypothetical protein
MAFERDRSFRLKDLGRIMAFHVWIVDGDMVRHEIDTAFVGGANPARHKYLPRNEIWVENGLRRRGTAPVIVHEIVETIFIREHKESYEKAHEDALLVEKFMRQEIAGGKVKKSDPITMVMDFFRCVHGAAWLSSFSSKIKQAHGEL